MRRRQAAGTNTPKDPMQARAERTVPEALTVIEQLAEQTTSRVEEIRVAIAWHEREEALRKCERDALEYPTSRRQEALRLLIARYEAMTSASQRVSVQFERSARTIVRLYARLERCGDHEIEKVRKEIDAAEERRSAARRRSIDAATRPFDEKLKRLKA